jgi:hypothetical protein
LLLLGLLFHDVGKGMPAWRPSRASSSASHSSPMTGRRFASLSPVISKCPRRSCGGTSSTQRPSGRLPRRLAVPSG